MDVQKQTLLVETYKSLTEKLSVCLAKGISNLLQDIETTDGDLRK